MKNNISKSSETPSSNLVMLCSSDELLNQILSEVRDFKTSMDMRVTSLELSISLLTKTCSKISNNLDVLSRTMNKETKNGSRASSPTPNEEITKDDISNKDVNSDCIVDDEKGSAQLGELQLVPFSLQNDYPNGSWLGNHNNPSQRVRCHISSEKMLHINATCISPTKMALFLLDNLFTKDELSVSNVSGRSRWGKKQLNPLIIFGIKCHLQHRFNISEKDWHRICLNIDSKCRTAWKRRFKPAVKNSKHKIKICTFTSKDKSPDSASQNISFRYPEFNQSSIDFNNCIKVVSEGSCELSSSDQIARLEDSEGIIPTQEIISEVTEEKKIIMNSQTDVSINSAVMGEETLRSDLTICRNGKASLEDAMEEDSDSAKVNNTLSMATSSTATKDSGSCQIHPLCLKHLQLPDDHNNMLERDCVTDE